MGARELTPKEKLGIFHMGLNTRYWEYAGEDRKYLILRYIETGHIKKIKKALLQTTNQKQC